MAIIMLNLLKVFGVTSCGKSLSMRLIVIWCLYPPRFCTLEALSPLQCNVSKRFSVCLHLIRNTVLFIKLEMSLTGKALGWPDFLPCRIFYARWHAWLYKHTIKNVISEFFMSSFPTQCFFFYLVAQQRKYQKDLREMTAQMTSGWNL